MPCVSVVVLDKTELQEILLSMQKVGVKLVFSSLSLSLMRLHG